MSIFYTTPHIPTWQLVAGRVLEAPLPARGTRRLDALAVTRLTRKVHVVNLLPTREVVHNAEDEDAGGDGEYGYDGEDGDAPPLHVFVLLCLDAKV